MPLEWRSAAAQTFVGGRITRIDGDWRAAEISCGIMDIIDEWTLWDAAFPGIATDMKGKWELFRHGPSFAMGALQKLRKTAGLYEPNFHGPEIFGNLQQWVTQPLQRLFDNTHRTINFHAAGWFARQAGFDEYITMWDRQKTAAALNLNPDPRNPAHIRANARAFTARTGVPVDFIA